MESIHLSLVAARHNLFPVWSSCVSSSWKQMLWNALNLSKSPDSCGLWLLSARSRVRNWKLCKKRRENFCQKCTGETRWEPILECAVIRVNLALTEYVMLFVADLLHVWLFVWFECSSKQPQPRNREDFVQNELLSRSELLIFLLFRSGRKIFSEWIRCKIDCQVNR